MTDPTLLEALAIMTKQLSVYNNADEACAAIRALKPTQEDHPPDPDPTADFDPPGREHTVGDAIGLKRQEPELRRIERASTAESPTPIGPGYYPLHVEPQRRECYVECTPNGLVAQPKRWYRDERCLMVELRDGERIVSDPTQPPSPNLRWRKGPIPRDGYYVIRGYGGDVWTAERKRGYESGFEWFPVDEIGE